MIDMPPGITTANEGFGNIVWNILGQTYTLKQQSDASMAWHAVFPSGTFVPTTRFVPRFTMPSPPTATTAS